MVDYDYVTVKRVLTSASSTTDTDAQGKKMGDPRLSNLEMAKQIYGFSYGRFTPTEPPAMSYWPQEPDDWYILNHTGLNTYYQYDPINGWVNLGPNTSAGGGPVPTGASTVVFKNSFAGMFLNLFEVISRDNGDSQLLMTDQGFIVKKDIQAGGFLASSQGALWLGSGLTCQADPPMIMLANSNVQGILGGGDLDLSAVPGGWPFPSPASDGQLWYRTDEYNGNPANTLYRYNKYTTNWDVMGPKSDFEGYFDTLYVVTREGYKPDDSTLANMKLKKLIANEAHINDYYSKTGGNATFHGNVTGSASGIPVYSGSDPASPATGSIWLRTDL